MTTAMRAMEDAGYTVENTGGDCTAHGMDIGYYVQVTEKGHPQHATAWTTPVTVEITTAGVDASGTGSMCFVRDFKTLREYLAWVESGAMMLENVVEDGEFCTAHGWTQEY